MTMSRIILTVSELNHATQRLLEEYFPSIWIEGEISNLTKPTSGHLYFSLKDTKAQISCVMFRFKSQMLTFEPRNGLLVQLQAKVSLYTDRGQYQLIVEQMEISGDGLLKKAYEALYQKLETEGLFQEKWKKSIPSLPKQIGVVTSTTGAAIHDILSVLKRRFPYVPVIIYPTQVQGIEAAPAIIQALRTANQHQSVEVLILARGGGSLEDLWPFNEESVARAIFESQIPIITGIGHEIDFTIADFVADHRAPTPSAAAELATPHQSTLLQQFSLFETQLINEITQYCQHQAQRIDWLSKHIQHPRQQIENQLQAIIRLKVQLKSTFQQLLREKKQLLKNIIQTLETVSPLATLNRGYAIITGHDNNHIVQSVQEITQGHLLKLRLKDGLINALVVDTPERAGK